MRESWDSATLASRLTACLKSWFAGELEVRLSLSEGTV